MKRALLLLLAVSACTNDVDPPWQLDHERIVAVRATPPHIPAGATATIDLLVAHKGDPDHPTAMQAPDATTVVSPMSLSHAVSGATVTAPNEATLDDVRTELGLAPGAPVPLSVGVLANGLAATKTVWLGDTADNPTLTGILIDGVPPPATADPIIVGKDVDVPLAVDADDSTQIVNWLTSCGTMHDYDLHLAHVHVLPKDPQSGELAVIVRNPDGGVAWQVWSIAAQ